MSFLSTLLGGISSIFEKIPVVGEAIAGGVSSVTGEISAKDALDDERNWNATQAQINRDFQKNERLEAQQFNLDMWNKNNEYNSPAAQLKRATDAGINANSVIGGLDAGTAKQVTTSPAGGTPTAAAGSLASHLLLQDAQIQNLMANTRKTEAEADNETYNLTWNKMTENIRYDNLIMQNEHYDAEISKLWSDIGMNDFSKDLQEKQYHWFASKSEEEINVMREQVNLLYNQTQEVLKNIDLKDSQIDLNKSQEAANYSQARYNKYLAILADKQATTEGYKQDNLIKQSDVLDANLTGVEIENAIKDIELQYCEITGLPMGADHTSALFTLMLSGRHDDYLTLLGQKCLDNADYAAQYSGYKYGLKNIRDARALKNVGEDNVRWPGHNAHKSPYMRNYNERRGYINP